MTWKIGDTLTITWTTEDWYYIDENDQPQEDQVQIELSRDGGSTWSILGTIANTGSYNWVVTGPATSNAKLKFSGVYLTDITSISNAFSIIPNTATINPLPCLPLGGNMFLINYSTIGILSGNLIINNGLKKIIIA